MLLGLWTNYWNDWQLYHKCEFDGINKRIIVHPEVTSISVKVDIYSDWKEWVLLRDNSKFTQALRTIGGDPVGAGQYAGDIYFLMNGWKIYIDHSVNVDGVIFTEDNTSPFIVPSNGNIVTNKVSNLVQTVATDTTSGGSTSAVINPADIWNYKVEGNYTAGMLLKVLASIAAGKTTIDNQGGGNALVYFRDLTDSVDRVTATMAGSERTQIALDLTDTSGGTSASTSGHPMFLSQLSDVNVSGVNKNEVLKWNGSEWVDAAYNASFTFSIASFNTNIGATTIEIGNGVWKALGSISFNAAYNNGPATNAYVSHAGWNNITMGGAGFVGPTTSISADSYPAVGGTKVFTLNATDGTDLPTASLSYSFFNNLYWGVSNNSVYTSGDVVGLASKTLANSRVTSFTVVPGAGQYIVYAYPSRLGLSTFTIGGFVGGFSSPQTIVVINGSGYSENYYVYKSTNAGLGSTTVVVS